MGAGTTGKAPTFDHTGKALAFGLGANSNQRIRGDQVFDGERAFLPDFVGGWLDFFDPLGSKIQVFTLQKTQEGFFGGHFLGTAQGDDQSTITVFVEFFLSNDGMLRHEKGGNGSPNTSNKLLVHGLFDSVNLV